MNRRPVRNGGFTLIEIMVVLAILALSAALAVPSLVSGLGTIGLRSTTRKMASYLRSARNMALRNRAVYYAEARGGRLVIKTRGAVRPEREIEVKKYSLTDPDERAIIAFYPGGGSSGGVLEVKDPKSRAYYEIMVDPPTGRVRVSTVKRYAGP